MSFAHFEISEEIGRFALDCFQDQLSGYDEIVDGRYLMTPQSARLPAENLTVKMVNLLFYLRVEGGLTLVHLRRPDNREWAPIGCFSPGGAASIYPNFPKYPNTDSDEHHEAILFAAVHEVAHTLAIVNQPRLVALSSDLPRQQRRSLSRSTGFEFNTWTRVSWDISAETKAKILIDPSFIKMPLHFRRGHYRRAKEHYRNAIQLPNAIRPSDRVGWWQWIEGHWVGHPAFGVKKSIHAPRLSA